MLDTKSSLMLKANAISSTLHNTHDFYEQNIIFREHEENHKKYKIKTLQSYQNNNHLLTKILHWIHS